MKAQQMASEVAAKCIALRVRRLSRLMTRIFDDAMRPHGLTIAQYSILSAMLWVGPQSASELGLQLDLEKSTVSRNVARMIDRGWIGSRRAAGRTLELRVLDEGRKLFERAHPSWQAAQKSAADLMVSLATVSA